MTKSQNQNEESENTRSAFSFSLWFLHESILLSELQFLTYTMGRMQFVL